MTSGHVSSVLHGLQKTQKSFVRNKETLFGSPRPLLGAELQMGLWLAVGGGVSEYARFVFVYVLVRVFVHTTHCVCVFS